MVIYVRVYFKLNIPGIFSMVYFVKYIYMFCPDMFCPGIFYPGIFYPGICYPGMFCPGIFCPGIFSSGIFYPSTDALNC